MLILKPPGFLAVTALCACLGALPVEANEQLQLTLTAGSESNVNRGFHDPGILSSGYVGAQVQAGKLLQLALNDSLLLGTTFSTRRYGQLGGFDQLSAELSATWNHKFGFGAYAPHFNASVAFGRVAMRGEARDRDFRSLDFTLGKRISPAWSFFLGISARQNRASPLPYNASVAAAGYDPQSTLPYQLYDYDSQSISLAGEYTFANGVMLTGRYERINGSTIASTNHPDPKVYKIASAFYLDSAFAHSWYAYQLDSNSDVLGLSLSVPIARDTAVDLLGGWYDISAPAGKKYDNSEIAIGITWGF